MTGYGQANFENEQLRVNVAVKTINAKQAEVSLKLPKELSSQEVTWRNMALTHLTRGKINVSITYERKYATVPPVHIDQSLFKAYYNMLKALAEEVDATPQGLFQLALQLPEVTSKPHLTAEQAIEEAPITKTLQEALQHCDQSRQQEGTALATKLLTYLKAIKKSLEKVATLDPTREDALRQKLQASVSALVPPHAIDEQRLAQELFYYIERLDITEEKVRLAQHLAYFEEVMSSPQAVGKKLGFIAQEIGREINTIGAKASHVSIQHEVVRMKEELEKIKEQLCNIL